MKTTISPIVTVQVCHTSSMKSPHIIPGVRRMKKIPPMRIQKYNKQQVLKLPDDEVKPKKNNFSKKLKPINLVPDKLQKDLEVGGGDGKPARLASSKKWVVGQSYVPGNFVLAILKSTDEKKVFKDLEEAYQSLKNYGVYKAGIYNCIAGRQQECYGYVFKQLIQEVWSDLWV